MSYDLNNNSSSYNNNLQDSRDLQTLDVGSEKRFANANLHSELNSDSNPNLQQPFANLDTLDEEYSTQKKCDTDIRRTTRAIVDKSGQKHLGNPTVSSSLRDIDSILGLGAGNYYTNRADNPLRNNATCRSGYSNVIRQYLPDSLALSALNYVSNIKPSSSSSSPLSASSSSASYHTSQLRHKPQAKVDRTISQDNYSCSDERDYHKQSGLDRIDDDDELDYDDCNDERAFESNLNTKAKRQDQNLVLSDDITTEAGRRRSRIATVTATATLNTRRRSEFKQVNNSSKFDCYLTATTAGTNKITQQQASPASNPNSTSTEPTASPTSTSWWRRRTSLFTSSRKFEQMKVGLLLASSDDDCDDDQEPEAESSSSSTAHIISEQQDQPVKSKPKMNPQRPIRRSAFALGLLVVMVAALASARISTVASQAPPSRSQGNQPLHNQHQHPHQHHNHNQNQVAPPPGAAPPPSSASARPAPQPAAGSLVATVNCNKIRGHVSLTPNAQGGTTVSTHITAGPPSEVYQWSVHQFPVKPGAAMCTCSSLILGTKLIDLGEMHGNLPSHQEFNVQSSLNLFGAESPIGHSLLLRGLKTGVVACATFLPTSRKANYRAKFHYPLSGSVTIFQSAFGTSFLSHLMYSNGTRRHSLHRFDLVKSDEDLLGHRSLLLGQAGSSNNQATSANDQKEHENELNLCKRFTSGESPLFRNVTWQLAVSTENFGMRSRTALVMPQIPFETFASVYVIVYSEFNPSEPIACAPLKFVKPKMAAAKFQSVSVQGSVVFSQESPYDPTLARINLQLPNSDGHSYGIDELPMIIRRKSDTRVCPNIREIIYNPHHIEPSSVPTEGEATSDQYAVGDLSGKYGSLAGKSSEKIQATDFNLPLFGPNSIVGRAMTIYSADGVAVACSNVELTAPMTTAFATFDFGIQGQFIFRQAQGDCNGDTYVYIEASKPVGQQASSSSSSSSSGVHHDASAHSRSLDHNWHVHMNPVDSGLDHLSTTECSAAGGHFNPYNTSTSTIYSRDCTPFNVLRCELGDLSSKMFTLEIPPYKAAKSGQEPEIGKFFGTDIDLPLCGPVSVVNRSVVVHVQDFGVQRLACSTIIEFKPRNS